MDVFEIKQAIKELSTKDQWEITTWFEEFMADKWDNEIEQDVASGKLDKIVAKVDAAVVAGHSKPV